MSLSLETLSFLNAELFLKVHIKDSVKAAKVEIDESEKMTSKAL
jgi:hypothetical protein